MRNKIVIGSEVVGIANTRNTFCLVIASPKGVAISFLLFRLFDCRAYSCACLEIASVTDLAMTLHSNIILRDSWVKYLTGMK